MRVVLNVSVFPQTAETFIVTKFVGLLKQGADMHIVCDRINSAEHHRFPQLTSSPGVRQRVRPLPRKTSRVVGFLTLPWVLLRTFVKNPSGTWRYLSRGWKRFGTEILFKLHRDSVFIELRPDIIHFEFTSIAMIRAYLGDLLDTKIVASCRGSDINVVGLERPDYYDELWKSADAVHFVGRYLRDQAERRGFTPTQLHEVITPAVDADYFAPEQLRQAQSGDRRLRVLSVGRLVWQKGYEIALEAIKLARDSGCDIEFRIVGDGPDREAIEFCCHQLGLADCVTMLGSLSRDHVRREMTEADVFVQASVCEGLANCVMEAQAMELPIVTSDAGGLPEVVEAGVTGFVVPRRDPLSIAEKLVTLASLPQLRIEMGRAGRRRILARFQVAQQIDAFALLYSRLARVVG